VVPRQDAVGPTRSSGSGRSGPYSPLKDPTIVVLLLVVAVTVVLMITGATTGLVGGGASGPVFPIDFDDGNRTVTLSVDGNRSTATVGDAVAYEVTRGASDDPVANATVSVAGETYRTGADGRVVVTVERAGEYEVVAAKAPTNTTEFRPARVRLTVERRVAALELSANASSVRAGDAVRYTVRRADTGDPVDGTVAVAGREVRARNGTATVVVAAAGEYEATARAPSTDRVRFESASAPLTVERRVAALRVRVETGDEFAPTNATVRVRRGDTGDPVNATVAVGNRTVRTGEDGLATVRLTAAGEYAVTATAPETPAVRFRTGRATLTVDRRSVPLAVELSPGDELTPDESLSVTLVRADTGEAVAGTVSVGERTYDTGADGGITVDLADAGRYAVVGTKANSSTERFERAERTVAVVAPAFRVADVRLPERATAGGTATAELTVRNVGTAAGETTVRYVVGGVVVASERVALAAGNETTVTLDADLAGIATGDYLQWVVVEADGQADVLVVGARDGRVTTLAAHPASGAGPPIPR